MTINPTNSNNFYDKITSMIPSVEKTAVLGVIGAVASLYCGRHSDTGRKIAYATLAILGSRVALAVGSKVFQTQGRERTNANIKEKKVTNLLSANMAGVLGIIGTFLLYYCDPRTSYGMEIGFALLAISACRIGREAFC